MLGAYGCGVFKNDPSDVNENFYNSVASMYQSVINSINKHKNSEIFNIFRERLKAVVDNTSGIGWGFHDELGSLYCEIKWIGLEDIHYRVFSVCTV